MKINVIDKTEKLKLGKYYELRGNFVEQKDEDGNISYECDMFRTMNKNNTFEKLYKELQTKEAIEYLEKTRYVADNLVVASSLGRETEYLNETSSTFGITNREILQKRWDTRALINQWEVTQ